MLKADEIYELKVEIAIKKFGFELNIRPYQLLSRGKKWLSP
jgi:hypothetical protein